MGDTRSPESAPSVADGRAQLRLFVALEVPEARKISIEKAIQSLRLNLPKARWTTREQWHVTLKFLGEVPEDRLPEVVEIAGTCGTASPPVGTRLTEIGSFPRGRRARVIWVGLEDDARVMALLAATLEEELGGAGFRKEGRDLHPHLTLARFRVPQPIEQEMGSSGPYEFDRTPFEVGEIVLFRSHLNPKGATYEPLEHFPLAGAPARN